MQSANIDIAANYENLCEKVVQEIWLLSEKKIATQGRFSMVLSGGSTPKGIYQWMAKPAYLEKFNWKKIHLFWGDERWVPPEDQKSNYRMVSEALLKKIKIPSGNIHPVLTQEGDLESSVRSYEEMITRFFNLKKSAFPVFDLVLLGLGQDGHTASLFPGNSSLLVKDRLAVSTSQEGIPEKRITLTLPAINHAQMIYFVVSGVDKAGIVREVFDAQNDSKFPANHINPAQGNMCWFLDRDAAARLEK